MFDGFTDERITVGDDIQLRVRHGGAGPAVLLVHGHPRTGSTWHLVAPALVEAGFAVVCPDMRGYGASSKPPVARDHSQQSKRAVAGDLVRLMQLLGHDRFALAGHDRGCYVGLRAALDHPDSITHLVAMDGVPISEALARCDARFAHDWYHWFFYAQPEKPERAILADPDRWYGGDAASMGEENHREFRAATRDAATVRAMLEDYRAGLGIDREHEEQDRRDGRTIRCPALLLWAIRDDLERLYTDPLAVWEPWADDIVGAGIDSGHHMAEERPEVVSRTIAGFLKDPANGWRSPSL